MESLATLKIDLLGTGTLHIRLNRPSQLNALSHAVLAELSHVLNQAHSDSHVKSVLISGEGKAFCAGADITELAGLDAKSGLAFARFGQSVFNQLESLGKPSLAALHGYAFGGGCELAMAATLRIAAMGTQLAQPEIKLGVIPGFGGTQRLTRLIGKGRALALCLTGKRFSADEASQWGMVNQVVSQEALIPHCISFLDDINRMSAVAIQGILSSMQHGYDISLNDALQMEAMQFAIACSTQDKKEGVTAFLEKRTPEFIGE